MWKIQKTYGALLGTAKSKIMTLPEDFQQQTRALMGDEMYEKLVCGLASEPVVSIRRNVLKWKSEAMQVADADGGVPWCKDGFYLRTRPNFTFDPLLHAGLYYVQDASSMFVDLVVRQLIATPVQMLDLCAAPGGKSTALRSALPEGSLLVSNEPMRPRANVLSENMQKQGHPDVIVTNNFPRDFRKSGLQFDAILADVPCSGEGMFRKDSGAIEEWSLPNVDKCWQLQREIVADIWPCLKPGGVLTYSTCTFNNKEDEQNVEWIAAELGADFVEIDIEKEWNIVGSLASEIPAYRFLPGFTRGEGLFLCVLRKHGEASSEPSKRKEKPQKQQKQPSLKLPLTDADSYETLADGNRVFAMKKLWHQQVAAALRSLNVVHAGVVIGEQKGKDLIPDPSLALSIALKPDAFPRVPINHDQAIAFLRKETLVLPAETPRGYVLLTYRSLPIGFAKNLGNRANNLYPAPWRIKSTHIPEPEDIVRMKQEA